MPRAIPANSRRPRPKPIDEVTNAVRFVEPSAAYVVVNCVESGRPIQMDGDRSVCRHRRTLRACPTGREESTAAERPTL